MLYIKRVFINFVNWRKETNYRFERNLDLVLKLFHILSLSNFFSVFIKVWFSFHLSKFLQDISLLSNLFNSSNIQRSDRNSIDLIYTLLLLVSNVCVFFPYDNNYLNLIWTSHWKVLSQIPHWNHESKQRDVKH